MNAIKDGSAMSGGTRGLNLPDMDSSHKSVKLVSATGTLLIFKE